MNNVRTEQTPLWSHSTESLINSHFWPETEREVRKWRQRGNRKKGDDSGWADDFCSPFNFHTL